MEENTDIRNEYITLCYNNRFNEAKLILEKNPALSKYSSMVFMYACKNGNLEAAKWLLKISPTTNINGYYESFENFRCSCEKGYLEQAKWLFEINPNIKLDAYIDAVYDACKNGHFEIVKWLFETKQDINIDDEKGFENCCKSGNLELVKWFLGKKPDIQTICSEHYIFISTCCNGYIELAKWLLQFLPNLNMSHYSYAFGEACKNGHLEVAKWLLEIKPDININCWEGHNFYNACTCGHLEIVKFLIEKKAYLDVYKFKGGFKNACIGGYLEVAKFLYEYSPNTLIEYISDNNEKIFREVCREGHLKVAKWLLIVKPDIDISAKENEAFLQACWASDYDYDHYPGIEPLEIAKWLHSICPEKYYVEIVDDELVSYRIIEEIIFINTINIDKEKIEKCIICYKNNCNVQTSCNHSYCQECITKWLDKSKTCPTCRINISIDDLFKIESL